MTRPTRDKPSPPDDATKQRSKVRGDTARAAWDDWRTAHGPKSVYGARTRAGNVRILSINAQLIDGVTCLEVVVDGPTQGGDPHFRIINPPTLMEDPSGTVTRDGKRRLRVDPLAALAEVIGQHGGALKDGGQ